MGTESHSTPSNSGRPGRVVTRDGTATCEPPRAEPPRPVVAARARREPGGCAVPAIGGGLCMLSNALFAIAVDLGWTVLERHGHSMALADPSALDATIAYPHVDLRIAPRGGVAVLDVAVRGDVLVVAVRA